MASRFPEAFLVVGSMDIDEPLAGVGVLGVEAIQPQDPGHDQVLFPQHFVRELYPTTTLKNSSNRHPSTDFFRNSKSTGGGLSTAYLGSKPKSRRGNWVST